MNLANKILAKVLSDDLKSSLSQKYPDWPALVRKREIRVRVWLGELASELVKLTILTVIMCFVYIGVLYFLQGSWYLFADTMVGSRYIENVNAAGAAEIESFLTMEFKSLGVTIVLLTVAISIIVGILSQLTMLRRLFYVARSTIIKLGWVGIVSAVVAQRVVLSYQIESSLAFGLCLLPTFVFLSPVLTSTGRLLPELNLLLYLEKRRERRDVQNLKDDIAQLMGDNSGKELD